MSKELDFSKKSIVHVTCVHSPFDSRIYWKMCKGLAEKGFDVKLIYLGKPQNQPDGDVLFVHAGNFRSRLSRATLGVLSLVRASLKAKAVIHFHDPEFLIAGLFLRLLGVSVVYDVHEDIREDIAQKEYIPAGLRAMSGRLAGFVEDLSVRFFSGIVCATPFIADRFTGLNSSVIIARNFPDDFFRSHYNSAVDKEYDFVYIGGLSPTRGIEQICECAKELSEFKFAVAGAWSSESYRNKVMGSEGWGDIEYFGYINLGGIADLLNRSKVGLVLLDKTATFENSIPIKTFEYLAYRLPVVMSDFKYWRSLFAGFDCCYFADDQNLSEILLESQAGLTQLDCAKWDNISNHFSWSGELDRIEELYTDILCVDL